MTTAGVARSSVEFDIKFAGEICEDDQDVVRVKILERVALPEGWRMEIVPYTPNIARTRSGRCAIRWLRANLFDAQNNRQLLNGQEIFIGEYSDGYQVVPIRLFAKEPERGRHRGQKTLC